MKKFFFNKIGKCVASMRLKRTPKIFRQVYLRESLERIIKEQRHTSMFRSTSNPTFRLISSNAKQTSYFICRFTAQRRRPATLDAFVQPTASSLITLSCLRHHRMFALNKLIGQRPHLECDYDLELLMYNLGEERSVSVRLYHILLSHVLIRLGEM